jgi:hypothetical protein
MNVRSKLPLLLSLLNLLVLTAEAGGGGPMGTWLPGLEKLAYALGWMMMVIMGVKWIIADSPNERADAKKGMIYIVIGLLVVRSSGQLIKLYCDNAAKSLGGKKVC